MSMMVNDLSTGDVMVFDRTTRDLYLVPKSNAAQWHNSTDKSISFAKTLADQGVAKHYDKNALTTLQSALSQIVLLAVNTK